ncbi:flagellar type III secretion system protein FlhB [Rhodobacteraceae bacterium DSL-40]|uniref:EscU/YscU/HrcU family type III secretion system export apparatus switch protein n=1 Tax=Amaricoccus sp. B4 TaxID=3368557 RepID=UPI000DAC3C80
MSEDSGGGGEKTFDPTPQRLQEARKKGNIPRSQDLTAALVYLALLGVVMTVGSFAIEQAASVLMIFISQPDRLVGHILGPGGPRMLGSILSEALWALGPFFLIPIAAVVVSLIAQRAVTFSGEKLQPKLNKISPLSNAKQKFGPTGLVEFAKSFVKLSAIAIALAIYLRGDLDRMIGAARSEAHVTATLMMDSLKILLAVVCLIATVIAAVDVLWQRFDHARKLKMSYQDLKEEVKEAEGDPHMKAQRRQRAQAIAMNRMLLDVPKADVIIVNPTHYAVALQWSREKGSAPVCVAKGENEIALRIREIAETAQIPIHSDPPTARALHATVEIGQEILPDHYRAVAAAIRFADSLRKAARARGDT